MVSKDDFAETIALPCWSCTVQALERRVPGVDRSSAIIMVPSWCEGPRYNCNRLIVKFDMGCGEKL